MNCRTFSSILLTRGKRHHSWRSPLRQAVLGWNEVVRLGVKQCRLWWKVPTNLLKTNFSDCAVFWNTASSSRFDEYILLPFLSLLFFFIVSPFVIIIIIFFFVVRSSQSSSSLSSSTLSGEWVMGEEMSLSTILIVISYISHKRHNMYSIDLKCWLQT